MTEITASAAAPGASAPAPVELVAGRYVRGRTIARSEHGTLHEALHVSTRRPVALRSSHRSGGQSAQTALAREAGILGATRHPNIVDIYDAGELSGGEWFLALELLEGKTLEAILAARGALGAIETAWIGVEVASGLAALHARGFAHRDIRPRHVVVVRGRGGADALKIIGFAHASALRLDNDVDSAERADAGVDVRALAAMLQELLGATPGIESRAESPGALLSRGDEREDLAGIIARGLSDSPRDRFPSLHAFLTALAIHSHGPRRSLLPPLGSDIDPLDVAITDDGPRVSAKPPPLPHARRRVGRAPFVAPITIVHDGQTTLGESEDLSEGGMLALAPRAFPRDTTAIVRFVPPGLDHEIEVRGAVRWMRTARAQIAFGVEFLEPPAQLTRAIAAWVATRDPGGRA